MSFLRAKTSKRGERNMLVSLMQKPDKRNRALVKNLHIGFSVFEVNTVVACLILMLSLFKYGKHTEIMLLSQKVKFAKQFPIHNPTSKAYLTYWQKIYYTGPSNVEWSNRFVVNSTKKHSVKLKCASKAQQMCFSCSVFKCESVRLCACMRICMRASVCERVSECASSPQNGIHFGRIELWQPLNPTIECLQLIIIKEKQIMCWLACQSIYILGIIWQTHKR